MLHYILRLCNRCPVTAAPISANYRAFGGNVRNQLKTLFLECFLSSFLRTHSFFLARPFDVKWKVCVPNGTKLSPILQSLRAKRSNLSVYYQSLGDCRVAGAPRNDAGFELNLVPFGTVYLISGCQLALSFSSGKAPGDGCGAGRRSSNWVYCPPNSPVLRPSSVCSIADQLC